MWSLGLAMTKLSAKQIKGTRLNESGWDWRGFTERNEENHSGSERAYTHRREPYFNAKYIYIYIYIYIERERERDREREENLRLSFSSSLAGRESETERWRAWEKGGWDWVANIKESESVGESLSTPSESGNGLDDNVEGGLEGVADGGLKEWKCGWVGEGMRVRVRVRDSWMAERRIDRVGIRVWYKWYLYIELGFFFFFW